MEVEIKTRPAFAVLGIEGCGDADKGPEWIGPLWEKAFKRFDEIRDLVKSDKERWGLLSATDEYLGVWKKEGRYLAGWEVEPDTKAPEGWTVWDVPEQMYAVVACTWATYLEAFQFVLQQFLPREGYEQVGELREFYPEEFHDIERNTIYLYFPVKEK